MSNIFSKFLKDRSGNRPIRMGNQLEHGGVIAQTESLAVVDEPITFTSTVDFTDATVVGLPFYTTEISAIDAGLAFGDKYVDSDGVIQTVTKIKQTLTFTANQTELIGFMVDITALTPTQFFTTYFSPTNISIASTSASGTPELFDSTAPEIFNDLTAFVVGKGYYVTSLANKTITIYGKPINTAYKLNIINGTNLISWVDTTTTQATALANYSGTKSSVTTVTAGVTVNNPANFEKGKGYSFSCNATTAAIGSPSTAVPVEDSRPYKVYTALLTQTGSNAPVANVLENTLGGVPVWGYVSLGVYTCTLTGEFTTNKTSARISGVSYAFTTTGIASEDEILVLARDISDNEVDGVIVNQLFEIRVYK